MVLVRGFKETAQALLVELLLYMQLAVAVVVMVFMTSQYPVVVEVQAVAVVELKKEHQVAQVFKVKEITAVMA